MVDSFLRSLSPGAVGLDIGCGNGKYLAVRNDIYIVASDYSTELVKIASQHEPHSSLVADTLNLPHPQDTFDFAICIAVIHHFSTPERRIESVRHILEKLRPSKGTIRREKEGFEISEQQSAVDQEVTSNGEIAGNTRDMKDRGGEVLFFVWALEQKNSRRGWDENHEQDVLVPWVLKPKHQQAALSKHNGDNVESSDALGSTPTTYHRYYHLYRRHELEEDVLAAGGEVVNSGYDRDNWWCIARRQRSIS